MDEATPDRRFARRHFLIGGASAVALGTGALATAAPVWAAPLPPARIPEGLFTLGVASGDPAHDSVVLWTRLAADPLALDGRGDMPAHPVAVQWEIAHDERFSRVVRRAATVARPENAHAVHVEVDGLDPDRWYFYRFRVGREISPAGRTRTAPAPGVLAASWTFAIASCQNRLPGYYTAYQNMAAESPDLVVHLGDYIYENGGQGNLGRGHLPRKEIRDLADYRVRLAQYKTDPDLLEMHRSAPFAMTFDDHEVENNWSADDADPDVAPEVFAQRKADAFKAYWEHMPLRAAQRPSGPAIPMYRRLHWGALASVNLLDTRQYRSDQVADAEADGPEAWEPDRTMLGSAQERWLLDDLTTTSARWNVLAQQVPFFEDPDVRLENDKWDGYRVARQNILDAIAGSGTPNPVVLSGDIHSNRAADLKADFDDPESATVGAEFTGTSISSGGDAAHATRFDPDPENPHIRLTGTGRGYVVFRVDPDVWRADFRIVDTVRARTSGVSTVASFVVEDDRPGLTRA